MKIRKVEFVASVPSPSVPLPEGDLPQVAFSGRSNVGKSSLINTVLRRTQKSIARVSATPGKTQALNFFRVNGEFFLVDLPGFGYARVPKRVRESWKTLIESYLQAKTHLRGVVHLVDARHEPTPGDVRMVEFLATVQLPTLVVLTKMDKITRSRRAAVISRAASTLNIDRDQILPFSSKTSEGRDELLEAMDALLTPEGDPS